MKINEIKKTKSGKYKVKIDNQVITTYDDVLINNSLLYKKEIDEDLYQQINLDTAYYDVYNKTINYILRKTRSEYEIKKFLDKFDISEKDSNKIIEHLKCVGLINDNNFIKSYISDRVYLSNDGPDKIKNELISHNIDVSIIEEEIYNIDKNVIHDKLKKIIAKKINSDHKHSAYQLKQKIITDLINMGYSKDLILEILDTYSLDDDDLLSKEYQKIYTKLSKNYSGIELGNKIKQKLYAKGFNINEIVNLLDKKREDF